MKVKNVIITIATIGVIAAGGIVAAMHFGFGSSSSAKVEVTPVSYLNNNWFGDEDSMSEGTIVSKSSQNVDLNSEYELTGVYVKEGDEVKKGDELLSYDMTMLQLQLEVQELKSQMLDLDLTKQQRDLDKILKKPGAQAIYAKIEQSTEAQKTQSADDVIEGATLMEDGDELEPDNTVKDSSLETDPALIIDPNLVPITESNKETDQDQDLELDDEPEVSDPNAWAYEGDNLIEDDDSGLQEAQGNQEGVGIINDFEMEDGNEWYEDDVSKEGVSEKDGDGDIIAEENEYNTYAQLRLKITEFLTLEQLMTDYQYSAYEESGSLEEFSETDIASALSIYEDIIAAKPDADKGTIKEFTDAFGDKRSENCYVLSGETWKALEELKEKQAKEGLVFYPETVAINLYKGYMNVAVYDLLIKMNKINEALTTAETNADEAPQELVDSLRSQIIATADAYYKLDVNRKLFRPILEVDLQRSEKELDTIDSWIDSIFKPISGENLKLGDPTDGVLSKLIARLNDTDVVQETEAQTERETLAPSTEALTDTNFSGYSDDFDDDDFGDFDDDDEEDEATLEESVRSARNNVIKAKLDVRENVIKVRELKRKLAGQTVKAQMDGVVKAAGTMDEPSGEDAFIIITGESGMYLEGSVGELDLEVLEEGDIINGRSTETGTAFTATITEISGYPQTGTNYSSFMSWSSEPKNNNASNYPFTAYIEDDTGLVEGSAEFALPSNKSSNGILLDPAYVRTDDQGREYVMKADENGLLKKQFVSTSMSYGMVKIRKGLTEEDQIAFPYGKNTVEGAQTVISTDVDSFGYTAY